MFLIIHADRKFGHFQFKDRQYFLFKKPLSLLLCKFHQLPKTRSKHGMNICHMYVCQHHLCLPILPVHFFAGFYLGEGTSSFISITVVNDHHRSLWTCIIVTFLCFPVSTISCYIIDTTPMENTFESCGCLNSNKANRVVLVLNLSP